MDVLTNLLMTVIIELTSFFVAYLAVVIANVFPVLIKKIIVLRSNIGILLVHSNDDGYGEIESQDKLWEDCRFSLLCASFGTVKYYFFTKIKNQFQIVKRLRFDDLQIIEKPDLEVLCDNYVSHVKDLSSDDIEIEKEMLRYQIDKNVNRQNSTYNKLATYVTIFLVAVPVIISFLDYDKTDSVIELFSFIWWIKTIGMLYLLYLLVNIIAWIFNVYKVRTISASKFNVVKETNEKNALLAAQYYKDFQQNKLLTDYLVGNLKNLEIWLQVFVYAFIIYMVILEIII